MSGGIPYPTEAQFAEINAYLADAKPLVTVLTQPGAVAVSLTATRNLESNATTVLAMDAHASGDSRPTNYNMQAEAAQ
jgi:hypothetical protein